MNRRKIDLHIEELILHGFPVGERRRIGDTMEMELARLMTKAGRLGRPEQDVVIPTMEGAAINLIARQKRNAIGQQIAQSIYSAIRQGMKLTGKKDD